MPSESEAEARYAWRLTTHHFVEEDPYREGWQGPYACCHFCGLREDHSVHDVELKQKILI